MKRFALSILLGCSLASAAIAAGAPTGTWPDTRVGALARGWVTAFNTGEDSMRVFLANHMAAKQLSEKAVPARVERYRTLREQYGRLQLERVVASAADELVVKLLDGDARSREFTFRSESQAPWKLQSVSLKETAGGLHGMFGGFHH
jgi:hypothetical protein